MESQVQTLKERSETEVETKQVGRRGFLVWLTRGSLAAAGALAVGQVIRFLAYEPPSSSSTVIGLGLPVDYRRGTLAYVPEAQAYVGHDASGLYVMDAVCTHLGCLVEQAEEGGFVCPCHDSHFDATGNAVTGPATKPMRFLKIWLNPDEGQLMVDRAEPVDPAARLAL
jgi:Rieske Fe-S protein